MQSEHSVLNERGARNTDILASCHPANPLHQERLDTNGTRKDAWSDEALLRCRGVELLEQTLPSSCQEHVKWLRLPAMLQAHCMRSECASSKSTLCMHVYQPGDHVQGAAAFTRLRMPITEVNGTGNCRHAARWNWSTQ